jgi:hypothetical protein
MTKRELLDLLKPFADDQYVFVNLHSEAYPRGCQVAIQGVMPSPPWYPALDLIGVVADSRNRIHPWWIWTEFSDLPPSAQRFEAPQLAIEDILCLAARSRRLRY